VFPRQNPPLIGHKLPQQVRFHGRCAGFQELELAEAVCDRSGADSASEIHGTAGALPAPVESSDQASAADAADEVTCRRRGNESHFFRKPRSETRYLVSYNISNALKKKPR